MFRLFVALPLPEMIRQRLTMLQAGVPGARWVKPESLHLTLRFIGEVEGGAAEDLDAALRRLSAPAFSFRLSGVGHFGPDRKPQMLWAGVERNDALIFAQERVERAVVAAGQPASERKFKPHVTLARLKEPSLPRVRRWLGEHGLFQTEDIRADRVVLYRSHLGTDGAHYEPLAEYPLEEA
ncbi:MAG: RNA 2',3'-cyclic phosphodiesterase [Alphaproteobacteria bacterium]|jgi:2'-5' RNA ligase|nr:RNA 2',3'-cyclic phosphodiesterase [Alphaproteobacteria bacterium]